MKKTMKILSIILMTILLVASISTISMASDFSATGIAANMQATSTDASEDITDMGNKIVGIITTIGVVVAVVVLLVLGIKYMMGSASEKAEYKKTMIPYLIGAVLIFGASAIVKVVVSIGTGF